MNEKGFHTAIGEAISLSVQAIQEPPAKLEEPQMIAVLRASREYIHAAKFGTTPLRSRKETASLLALVDKFIVLADALHVGAKAVEMYTRAIEIADATMISMLHCHALPLDEHHVTWAVIDDDATAVTDLCDANEALQDAAAWLVDRGLAEVVEAPEGLVIVLKGEVVDDCNERLIWSVVT